MKDHTASMIKSDVAFLKEKLMPTLEMWDNSSIEIIKKQCDFFEKQNEFIEIKGRLSFFTTIPEKPNIRHAQELIKFAASGNGEIYLSKDDYDYCVNFFSEMTPNTYIEEINRLICLMDYMINKEKEKLKENEDQKEPQEKIADLNIEYGKGEATCLIIGFIAICAAAIVAYFAH